MLHTACGKLEGGGLLTLLLVESPIDIFIHIYYYCHIISSISVILIQLYNNYFS